MVVVTGAVGFIGSHLVEELARRGHHVVGIDRRPGSTLTGDLTCHDELRDLLREADAVFHLAGAAGVRRAGHEAEATWWRDNVVATEVVLSSVPLTTPLVVTSSSSVYGGSSGRPSHEDDPLRPRGGYARSKAQVERLCAGRAARGGHVVVARPFTVAGERQRPDMALARWLEAAGQGRPLAILGSPERRRDVTDVRQVAAVLADLGQRSATGTVNIGTGRSHSLAELVAAVIRATGPTDVVIGPAHHDEVEATLADTTRCRQVVGFVPQTDLDDLVTRQAAAVSESAVVARLAVAGPELAQLAG